MLRVVVLVLLSFGLASSSVICPDGKACPDRSTCCRTDSGYECCPVPNAVCCPDRSHCCPQGFQCNTLTQMCERLHGSMALLQKMPAKPTGLSFLNAAVSDPKMAEQDECCLSSSGCCPVGFHCNKHKACVRDKVQYPRTELQHTPSIGSQAVITYCDRKLYCPMNNTCCKTPSDQWACCPYSLGICCPDKMHCCPYRYNCDRRSKSCIKEYASIPAALTGMARRN